MRRVTRLFSSTILNLNGKTTFHKRQLPKDLIALSSSEGRALFRESLIDSQVSGMESFFFLAEQFQTQSEPSLCALSSLAMVLNALNHDPKKIWKGAWRWVSEETLQCETTDMCGHSMEKIKNDGMSFKEFESLARCHSVQINSFRASNDSETSLRRFREAVVASSMSDKAEIFIIVNFSRKSLGQTGDGHFSPIGGYHAKSDSVLVMDVARFKYPPFWVSVERLWESMTVLDKSSGHSRGYFEISTFKDKDKLVEEAVDQLGGSDYPYYVPCAPSCDHDQHHHH